MGEDTHAKIDGFFNVVDAVIDETGHFLDRQNKAAQKAGAVAAKRSTVIDVEPAPPRPAASPSAAVSAKAPRFRVIESIDAVTNRPSFVVTDGVTRTECPSAEVAERVRKALEST